MMYLRVVISRLHSDMFRNSKLSVYRELKEDFECKKYLTYMESLKWVLYRPFSR